MQGIEAERIAITRNWDQLERDRMTVEERIRAGNEGLDELKEIYRRVLSDSKLEFPHPYDGVPRSEEWFKQSIVKLHEALEAEQLESRYLDAAMARLETTSNNLDTVRTETKAELRKISVAKREVKLGEMTEDLNKRLAQIDASLANLKQGTQRLLPGQPLSLDEVVARKRNKLRFDTAAFDAIMGDNSANQKTPKPRSESAPHEDDSQCE